MSSGRHGRMNWLILAGRWPPLDQMTWVCSLSTASSMEPLAMPMTTWRFLSLTQLTQMTRFFWETSSTTSSMRTIPSKQLMTWAQKIQIVDIEKSIFGTIYYTKYSMEGNDLLLKHFLYITHMQRVLQKSIHFFWFKQWLNILQIGFSIGNVVAVETLIVVTNNAITVE